MRAKVPAVCGGLAHEATERSAISYAEQKRFRQLNVPYSRLLRKVVRRREPTTEMKAAMLARTSIRARPVAMAPRTLAQYLSSKVTSGATGVYPDAPSPLQEFSVVYTDRALNHMSEPFKKVMLDMGSILKEVYHAESAVIIPGSGTYGMESVARQFVTGKKALVIRNGFFSFRWTQIFEQCGIPSDHTVLKARSVGEVAGKAQYAPAPIEEVVATILAEKPAAVFAPQVETSTGIILPDWYVKKVADAVHSVGGLMVLDCIASGTVWANMEALGVDALITAPRETCERHVYWYHHVVAPPKPSAEQPSTMAMFRRSESDASCVACVSICSCRRSWCSGTLSSNCEYPRPVDAHHASTAPRLVLSLDEPPWPPPPLPPPPPWAWPWAWAWACPLAYP